MNILLAFPTIVHLKSIWCQFGVNLGYNMFIMWIKRKVQKGTVTGRKIGFPTINLNVSNLAKEYTDGVYACSVKINNLIYQGALYMGAGFGHRKKILEIYIIGFSKIIYGKFISFKIFQKLRGTKKFDSLDELKKQIEKDISYLN